MPKTIYDPVYIRLVKRLIKARKSRSWTQLQAANRMGVTRHWLGKIERCETRLDLLQTLNMCRVYGINTTELLRQLDQKPS